MTTIKTTKAAGHIANQIKVGVGWVVFGHYCMCTLDGMTELSSPWKIYLDAGDDNVLVVESQAGVGREQFGSLMSAVLAQPLGLTDSAMNFVLLVETDQKAQEMVNELGSCFGIQDYNLLAWAKHLDREDTRVPIGPLMRDAIELVGPELISAMFIAEDESEPAGEKVETSDGE